MNKILLCDYVKLKTQECQNAAARCSCSYFFITFLDVSFLGNQISNVLKFQKEVTNTRWLGLLLLWRLYCTEI